MRKQVFTDPQYLKQLIIIACLPALVGMYFVQMIPTWEIVQPISMLIFLIMTLWFAFRSRSQIAPSQRSLLFRPLIFFPFLATFVLVLPMYFIATFRINYDYVATYQFKGLPTTLYVYETSCFLEARGSCDVYATDIKRKVGILPIMTNLLSCPCLFNKPYLQGNVATFTIETSRDKSKVPVSIDMKYGTVKVADY
jgi:predicted membrane protein